MEQCPRCESLTAESEEEVEFIDELADSVLRICVTAEWCDSCGWFKLGTN